MSWKHPINRILIPTNDRDLKIPDGRSPLPLAPHPGAFGVRRKHHTHEGVDLYCPVDTTVYPVEDGIVVAIIDFTGQYANPPSLWWLDTQAVLIEGESGVVVYGEIESLVTVGRFVTTRDYIGEVKQVLRKDKGYPMSMLHLELHTHGTRDAYEWIDEKPASLLDPTLLLMESLQ